MPGEILIGFKKYWDCKESLINAFENQRTPLTFDECVSPIYVLLKQNQNLVVLHDDDVLESFARIRIGQMRSRTGIKCDSGVSPVIKKKYKTYKEYQYTKFGTGIFFCKKEEQAWDIYPNIETK